MWPKGWILIDILVQEYKICLPLPLDPLGGAALWIHGRIKTSGWRAFVRRC